MSATPARTWWQRQRWYLIGAAAFGVWAVYAPYLQAWSDYARMHPVVPVDVSQGAQAGTAAGAGAC